MKFPLHLLTSWQLQSCLIPCISARIFIILKLLNIYWTKLISGELFSLCIEHCPDCYSVRPFYRNESLWDHLSRALPTEMIFGLLRSIRSERLIHDDYMLDTLEIIIKWLQVSVSEWNWQPSQTKIDLCLGTWSRATERLVRSLPGWTSSTQECSPLASTLKFGIWAYSILRNIFIWLSMHSNFYYHFHNVRLYGRHDKAIY